MQRKNNIKMDCQEGNVVGGIYLVQDFVHLRVRVTTLMNFWSQKEENLLTS
jgi:hypothetical protein